MQGSMTQLPCVWGGDGWGPRLGTGGGFFRQSQASQSGLLISWEVVCHALRLLL